MMFASREGARVSARGVLLSKCPTASGDAISSAVFLRGKRVCSRRGRRLSRRKAASCQRRAFLRPVIQCLLPGAALALDWGPIRWSRCDTDHCWPFVHPRPIFHPPPSSLLRRAGCAGRSRRKRVQKGQVASMKVRALPRVATGPRRCALALQHARPPASALHTHLPIAGLPLTAQNVCAVSKPLVPLAAGNDGGRADAGCPRPRIHRCRRLPPCRLRCRRPHRRRHQSLFAP